MSSPTDCTEAKTNFAERGPHDWRSPARVSRMQRSEIFKFVHAEVPIFAPVLAEPLQLRESPQCWIKEQ